MSGPTTSSCATARTCARGLPSPSVHPRLRLCQRAARDGSAAHGARLVALLVQPRRRNRSTCRGAGGGVRAGCAAVAQRGCRQAAGDRRLDCRDGRRDVLVHSARVLPRRTRLRRPRLCPVGGNRVPRIFGPRMLRISAAQFLPHFRISPVPEALEVSCRLHGPAVGREQREQHRFLARAECGCIGEPEEFL